MKLGPGPKSAIIDYCLAQPRHHWDIIDNFIEFKLLTIRPKLTVTLITTKAIFDQQWILFGILYFRKLRLLDSRPDLGYFLILCRRIWCKWQKCVFVYIYYVRLSFFMKRSWVDFISSGRNQIIFIDIIAHLRHAIIMIIYDSSNSHWKHAQLSTSLRAIDGPFWQEFQQ